MQIIINWNYILQLSHSGGENRYMRATATGQSERTAAQVLQSDPTSDSDNYIAVGHFTVRVIRGRKRGREARKHATSNNTL